MNIETQMFIALLKLTKDGPFTQELINRIARIPSQTWSELLQKMQNDHLIYLHDNMIDADGFQRLELAIRAIRTGADVEEVSRCLRWREFEAIAAFALENNGYVVQRNIRYKNQGRRWEIDVVGVREPLIVCIDCKHWHHKLCESTTRKIVSEQVTRVRALAGTLPNPVARIKGRSLDEYKFVPVVISLIVEKSKFFEGVPIVPILQLQDFLNYLPTSTDSIFCIDSTDVYAQSGRQKKLMD